MNALAQYGLPIQALAGVAGIVGLVVIGHALKSGLHRRVRVVATTLLAAAFGYVSLVAAVSMSSQERVLPMGVAKRFCGFYLDCHAMVSVVDVEFAETLGMGPQAATASGTFYVITLERSSDARGVPIGLSRPVAEIVDADGQRYAPSPPGMRALETTDGVQPPLGTPVLEGSPYRVKLVFDLPEGVASPRLRIHESDWLARLSEMFLIGDEDSFLHKKTLLAVGYSR